MHLHVARIDSCSLWSTTPNPRRFPNRGEGGGPPGPCCYFTGHDMDEPGVVMTAGRPSR